MPRTTKGLKDRTVADLREIASRRLLTVPAGTTKHELVRIIEENKRDYSKLRLPRIKEFLLDHRVPFNESDSRERLIEKVESVFTGGEPEEVPVPEVNPPVERPRVYAGIFINILPYIHPSIAFRFVWYNKITARRFLSEDYWEDRTKREGFPLLDRSKTRLWRHWYLAWNKFPIGGECRAWGTNKFGELGRITQKNYISDIISPAIEGRVIDVSFTLRESTVFLTDDGRVWHCGFGPMGWAPQFKKEEAKAKHAPHPIDGLPKIKAIMAKGSTTTEDNLIVMLDRDGFLYVIIIDYNNKSLHRVTYKDRQYCAIQSITSGIFYNINLVRKGESMVDNIYIDRTFNHNFSVNDPPSRLPIPLEVPNLHPEADHARDYSFTIFYHFYNNHDFYRAVNYYKE